jgi:diacylglycerol kinase (ATP)
MTASKKIKLVINPNSQPLKIALFLQTICTKFNKAGYEIDVYKTQGGGDATTVARETASSGEFEMVIAGGGDGTINEVINGLMPNPIKLGILPLGTSNVLCRALKLPLNPLKAVDAILSGKSIKIDVGLANDRYFAIMISCGFDAYAIEQTSLRVKKITGRYAYVIAGIKSIYHYQPKRIHLIADGKPMQSDAMLMCISNAHLYGGNYQLTPDAKIDDGLFDVFLYTGNDVYRFMYYLLRLFLHFHLDFPDTTRFRVKNLKLQSTGRVLYQGDGDLFGEIPLDISLIPSVLEIAGVKGWKKVKKRIKLMDRLKEKNRFFKEEKKMEDAF